MAKLKLGDSERELLFYVANHPNSTTREIVDDFAALNQWGRTTVLKTVERLMEKGFLTRSAVEGVYRYSATMTEGQIQQRLLEEFMRGSMGGSLSPLVAYLDGNIKVTNEELEQLKRLVDRLEKRERS